MGQTLVVDVRLDPQVRGAGQSDELEDTVNYGQIVELRARRSSRAASSTCSSAWPRVIVRRRSGTSSILCSSRSR